MKSILLAGGGTAGHITPHLALLPHLKKHFDKIYYIGSGKTLEGQLFSGTGVEIFNISPPALIRSLTLKNLSIPFKLKKSVDECLEIINKIKPSVIFSKGGYCALPVCFAGFKAGIPVICHESDISPGLANKLCIRRSTAFLTTFKETALKRGGIYVGPIIREEFFKKTKDQAIKALKINKNKPILLVTGGSQGSQTLNNCLQYNLDALLTFFTVIHLHGKNNKPLYSTINGYYPFSFADMPTVINACDIALSRGGSNTLFELLSLQVPTLCVPLKRNSRGDQIKNANYFKNKGAIMALDEDQLKDNLLQSVNNLYKRRNEITANLKKLNLENGRENTLKIILKHAKESK